MSKAAVIVQLLFLAFLPPWTMSQTSKSLKVRFGRPTQESFVVQSNIALTATYTADGRACQLNVHPVHPLASADDKSHLLPTKPVSDLLDTLIPPAVRGTLISEKVEPRVCYAVSTVEYSAIIISRGQYTCSPGAKDKDIHVNITFKGRECAVTAITRHSK